MGVARDERQSLVELFREVGPDAPTLCGEWRTRDLAAHLVLRERRPDAAVGVLVKPLAGHTAKVQERLAAQPWGRLVELVRTGPPAILRPLDELLNASEYFVHHEDVRRAADGWSPRPPEPVRDEALWKRVGSIARITFRKSAFGVVLRQPDGAEITARPGPRPVVLTGQVQELLLYACGRERVEIGFDGDEDAVESVRGLDRSM
ncbi:TIGR03085 family metal-binding protein [Saccharothrix violaceirubra]|uniref:Uncharacterized protein (TIGR03085 family) n=1 Tax=Saccharothrix violaceirubra TaxID=413306 RepID=A0A7W7T019_9PSEU|nr:TIGR03085 family metal-binding protein [Saccharothrix violaceirubra]MBB4964064.1 uncharacterized protein (TIGR03085 family) [Saccharothrix violaceirubra]